MQESTLISLITHFSGSSAIFQRRVEAGIGLITPRMQEIVHDVGYKIYTGRTMDDIPAMHAFPEVLKFGAWGKCHYDDRPGCEENSFIALAEFANGVPAGPVERIAVHEAVGHGIDLAWKHKLSAEQTFVKAYEKDLKNLQPFLKKLKKDPELARQYGQLLRQADPEFGRDEAWANSITHIVTGQPIFDYIGDHFPNCLQAAFEQMKGLGLVENARFDKQWKIDSLRL